GHSRRVRPHLFTHRTSGAVRRRQGRTRRARGHQHRHPTLRTRIPPGGTRKPATARPRTHRFPRAGRQHRPFRVLLVPLRSQRTGQTQHPTPRRHSGTPAVPRAPIPRLHPHGERGFRRPVSPEQGRAPARPDTRRVGVVGVVHPSLQRRLLPRVHHPTPGQVRGDGVRGATRIGPRRPRRTPRARTPTAPSGGVPRRGTGGRRRRHLVVHGLRPGHRLRGRAPVRRHAVRGVLHRVRPHRRVGGRTSALGQDAPARRGRTAPPVPAVRRLPTDAGRTGPRR